MSDCRHKKCCTNPNTVLFIATIRHCILSIELRLVGAWRFVAVCSNKVILHVLKSLDWESEQWRTRSFPLGNGLEAGHHQSLLQRRLSNNVPPSTMPTHSLPYSSSVMNLSSPHFQHEIPQQHPIVHQVCHTQN